MPTWVLKQIQDNGVKTVFEIAFYQQLLSHRGIAPAIFGDSGFPKNLCCPPKER
jgi:hypothetical protein